MPGPLSRQPFGNSTKHTRRRGSLYRRSRAGLPVERLEDRIVLSAVVATTVNDLINDIIAANNGTGATTIQLQAADSTNGFNFTSAQASTIDALPPITASITITGTGGFDNTIQRSTAAGTPAFRLFEVAASGSLTLQNVTVMGGLAQGTGTSSQGGGIYSAGRLNLTGVTVQGNEAQGINGVKTSTQTATPGTSASGGGLYMAGGTLSLSNDTITGNSAVGGNGGGGNNGPTRTPWVGGDAGAASGGGLYVAGGSVILNNNTISGNNATGGIGGYARHYGGMGGAGSGGGFYLAGGNVSMSGDTVTGNNAVGGAGGHGASGDALAVYGAGVSHGTGGTGFGGGLYVAANVVSLGITSETISNNKATGGLGGTGAGTAQGGSGRAINIAGRGGAAQGGGLYVAGGNVTLSADQLTSNQASGKSGGHPFPGATDGGWGGTGGSGFGGALYISGGSVTLSNDTLSGGSAVGGDGGHGNIGRGASPGNASIAGDGGLGGAGLGGGVYVTGGVVALSGGAITSNDALGGLGGHEDAGAGYGGNGGAASGGGIDVVGGTVSISGIAVSGNEAAAGAGGTSPQKSGAGGSATGGGMSVASGLSVSGDSGTSFSGNSVVAGTGSPAGTASFPNLAANTTGFGLYLLPGQTVTSITSSPGQSFYGQNVTFTASIAAGTVGLPRPTGTVTFYDGGTSIGVGSVTASGVAVLTTSALLAGSRSITAVYSGDSNYMGGTSSVFTFAVQPAPTSTVISSSANPSGIGQPVTYTATVTANSPSTALVNAGSVQFLIDGVNFGSPVSVNSNGVAVSAPAGSAQLTVGTHAISAVYSGTASFVTSGTPIPVTTSPTASYPLNETSGPTAYDASGNGFDGTYHGSITFGVPGPIAGTTAVQLNDGEIDFPAAPFGNYPTSGTTNNYSVTFEIWFNAPVGSPGGVILNQAGSVNAVMLGTDGKIRSTLFWFGSTSDVITSSSTYNDGNWHLLDTTYSNGTQSLYIDGALIGTQSYPETGYDTSDGYALGDGYTANWAGGNGGYFPFTGDLAMASVYSVALSQGQILARYGATAFTQTVTNSAIATTTSQLISDINAANNGTGPTTILLEAADATNGFDFTSAYQSTNDALPPITANITLVGIAGFDNTIQRSTASGTPAFDLLNISAGGSLNLQNLTLAGNVVNNSTLIIAPGNSTNPVTINTITGSGTLNVQGYLIINYGQSADPISIIQSQLASGYQNGAWNGSGIVSSNAAADSSYTTGVGYFDSGSQLTIARTWYGDANLDGVINSDDLSLIMLGQSQHGTRWQDGNFNYDTQVNADDWIKLMYAVAYSKGQLLQNQDGSSAAAGAVAQASLVTASSSSSAGFNPTAISTGIVLAAQPGGAPGATPSYSQDVFNSGALIETTDEQSLLGSEQVSQILE